MRLRFTIRDLLWLTALVALAVGWWVDHRRLGDQPYIIKVGPDGTATLTEKATQIQWIHRGATWLQTTW
jgi:hypothetical protein